jgi:hypothetical protein
MADTPDPSDFFQPTNEREFLQAIYNYVVDNNRRLTALKTIGEKIMSALSDYASKVDAFAADVDKQCDALKAAIAALQATQPTASDQAALDKALADLGASATKLDQIAAPPTP